MTIGEGYFVDANILVYAALAGDFRHAACRNLLRGLGGPLLLLSPQIVAEFYSIVTSAKRVTVPLTSETAIEFIEILLNFERVILLPISADVPGRWISLIRRRDARGPRIFDFQIAATMLSHGVTKLVTYNGTDFRDVAEIEILEPGQVGDSHIFFPR